LIPAIEESNNQQTVLVPRQIGQHLGSLEGKTIAVWEMAFKARTDDIRESELVLNTYLTAAHASRRMIPRQAC